MTIIKTEGFKMPGPSNVRPGIGVHRPFSDGSMTVETSLLQSLLTPNHMPAALPMGSPFAFSQSLPQQPQVFDYSMASPLSTSGDGFHPAAMFNTFKFGNEHPEPPINLSVAPAATSIENQRSRSQSSSRSSANAGVGKAPSAAKSRQGRKLSMNDVRPATGSIQQRGRSGLPPRSQSMSLHTRTASSGQARPLGLGVGLDTHIEDQKTNSISPPDFGMTTAFGINIPQSNDTTSWASGSLPTMVPGSFGSFSGETTTDEAIADSPMTPARPLTALSEESFKKQRRRQSHNAVEKRRREHINTKIEELSHLLPPMYNLPDDEVVEDEEEEEEMQHASPLKKKKTKRAGSNAKAQKDAAHCKGRILSQSVYYIRDLKFLTDKQSERIAQLEAQMLNFGINPTMQSIPPPPTHQQPQQPQQPLFWPTNTFSGIPPQQLGHQLEAMRPSPDPERPFSLDHLTAWGEVNQLHHTAGDVLMAFEPSPTDGSSASMNDFRRSSTVSSGEEEVPAAQDMQMQMPMQSPQVGDDVLRGRQRERTVRQDSQAELQMSMSGLFSSNGVHRDENVGGMRW